MIKHLLVLIVWLVAASTGKEAQASPCETTLCMFGMVTGNGGGDSCKTSIAEFFAISVVSGMFDTFNPAATAAKRKAYLQQCDNGTQPQIDTIINMFGETE
ncbi:hypothetical protein MCAMS1_01181 [biofilm metagenome]